MNSLENRTHLTLEMSCEGHQQIDDVTHELFGANGKEIDAYANFFEGRITQKHTFFITMIHSKEWFFKETFKNRKDN